MTFDEAVRRVLLHEGGFVDHPDDPGGATNFGITAAVARANGYTGDMRALPLQLAKSIYRREYWDAVRAEELPAGVRYAIFDAAVNSGVRQAVLWLQRAVGAKADGVFGPITLSAARAIDGDTLNRRFIAQRLRMLTQLPTWGTFGRGWARRIADVLEAA